MRFIKMGVRIVPWLIFLYAVVMEPAYSTRFQILMGIGILLLPLSVYLDFSAEKAALSQTYTPAPTMDIRGGKKVNWINVLSGLACLFTGAIVKEILTAEAYVFFIFGAYLLTYELIFKLLIFPAPPSRLVLFEDRIMLFNRYEISIAFDDLKEVQQRKEYVKFTTNDNTKLQVNFREFEESDMVTFQEHLKNILNYHKKKNSFLVQ